MEKTMIIVRGRPSSGKSAAISFAYEQLKNAGGIQILSEGEKRPRKRHDGPPEVRGRVLRINDVLVGFASPGDTPEHLDRCLKPLIERRCLVIIGANRHAPNHPTWRRAQELASDYDFQVVQLDKTALRKDTQRVDWQEDCDRANQDFAAKTVVPAILDAIARAQLPAASMA